MDSATLINRQSAIRNADSAIPHGTCWTTMRTRSLPTCISSGLPSCTGMVLPLTLISSGGTLVAADAPVIVVALVVLALAAPVVVVSVVAFCPVSAGGGAVGSRGLAMSPVRVKRVVATTRHVEG